MNINNFFKSVPPVTLHITIINVLVWLATAALAATGVNLNDYLGLHYWQCSQFGVWQLVTSMFMHDGLAHIFFNMFSLVMLGAWVAGATCCSTSCVAWARAWCRSSCGISPGAASPCP